MPMSPQKKRQWRLDNPDYLKQYRKENRERFLRYEANRNKDKVKARSKLNYFVCKGIIKRPEACERCRKSAKVEGHHNDYSKPLVVEWLCKECHYVTYHPERTLGAIS